MEQNSEQPKPNNESPEPKSTVIQPEKITLSSETERAIILAQLTENSSMLLSFEDIAQMTGYRPSHIQKNLSKSPSFPKAVELNDQGKNKRYIAGDVIRWIKRHRLH